MGEKRGMTGKLEIDFNTAWVQEVYHPKFERWSRVTEHYFRCFTGKRRLTRNKNIALRNIGVEQETFEYHGPVYIFDTNIKVNREDYPPDSYVYGKKGPHTVDWKPGM